MKRPAYFECKKKIVLFMVLVGVIVRIGVTIGTIAQAEKLAEKYVENLNLNSTTTNNTTLVHTQKTKITVLSGMAASIGGIGMAMSSMSVMQENMWLGGISVVLAMVTNILDVIIASTYASFVYVDFAANLLVNSATYVFLKDLIVIWLRKKREAEETTPKSPSF